MDAVERIRADFSQAVVVGDETPFVASPIAHVTRRKLDRIGGEIARATSLVRYAPGSRFPVHSHDGGEEFLVLEGTFSDAQGDYRAGTYVRNPVGSRHAPWSHQGCLILVKLHQMAPAETGRTVVETGFDAMPLFDDGRETVAIRRLAPGEVRPVQDRDEEILVLSGEAVAGGCPLGRHGWARLPRARSIPLESATGIVYWSKLKPFPS